MPSMRIDGTELHYEEGGHGFPILCMPGALGTGRTDFGPQLADWSSRFRVIAPDPRGFGQSRPPQRDFAVDFFLQDAHDFAFLMTQLGCETFHVAGWSDGANAAALLAAEFRDRVAKLAIWGGASYISREDFEGLERIRLISSWSTRMRQTLEDVYGDSLQAIWNAYCDSIRNRFESCPEICRRQLRAIRCPTLILHGALDPIVPGFHPQIFCDEIPSAQLHVFPLGRHNFHLAMAGEFNRVVLAFLDGDTSRLNAAPPFHPSRDTSRDA